MRANILQARQIQAQRLAGTPITANSQLRGTWLQAHCALTETEHQFLEQAVHKLGLSARAYTRVLRIARTIADLESADRIQIPHLAEAINFRVLDREDQW